MNQNRGELLRQFLQWRRQRTKGGRFFAGGRGGQFGGRFGRFQGGTEPAVDQEGEDIQLMNAEQRAQYRQRLEFRINWLEKRLAQAVSALEELDAFEAAEAGEGRTAASADPFAAKTAVAAAQAGGEKEGQ